MLILGAINKNTGEYVYPKIANKNNQYICPDCNKDLILCQGQIKAYYFRHKIDNNPCTYYDKPSETQIHKDAKMLLKNYLLDNKIDIRFIRYCNKKCCKQRFRIPTISETSKIELEYRFNFNNTFKIADVAYIDNNNIVCLFEICNTHKTSESDRPDNIVWFDIDVNNMYSNINNKYIFNCIRTFQCKKIKFNDFKLSSVTIINGNETYSKLCKCCGLEKYEPILYQNNKISLCIECADKNDEYKIYKEQIRKQEKQLLIPILYSINKYYDYDEQNLYCVNCKSKFYKPYQNFKNNKYYALCIKCYLINKQYYDNNYEKYFA